MEPSEEWTRLERPNPGTAQHFAHNTRRRREQLGLSQEGVVRTMRQAGWKDFNAMALSRIEKGARRVGVDEALAIASILEVDLMWLVSPSPTAVLAEQVFDARRMYETAQLQVEGSIEKLRAAKNICSAVVDDQRTVTAIEDLKGTLPPRQFSELREALDQLATFDRTQVIDALRELDQRVLKATVQEVSTEGLTPEDQAATDSIPPGLEYGDD